jgi:CRP-like cAMP-binding protein
MTDNTSADQSDKQSRDREIFPTLTAAQISRIAVHGRVRKVKQGEVLVKAGEQTARIFVVTAGQIETSAMSGASEEIVALMRAFILRRVELIARKFGDVVRGVSRR